MRLDLIIITSVLVVPVIYALGTVFCILVARSKVDLDRLERASKVWRHLMPTALMRSWVPGEPLASAKLEVSPSTPAEAAKVTGDAKP